MRINGKLNDLLTLLMESSWHREAHTNAPKKMEISQVRSFLDEHYKIITNKSSKTIRAAMVGLKDFLLNAGANAVGGMLAQWLMTHV